MKKIAILAVAAFLSIATTQAQTATFSYPSVTVQPGEQLVQVTVDTTGSNAGTYFRAIPVKLVGLPYTQPDTMLAPNGTTRIAPARVTYDKYRLNSETRISITLVNPLLDKQGTRYYKIQQR